MTRRMGISALFAVVGGAMQRDDKKADSPYFKGPVSFLSPTTMLTVHLGPGNGFDPIQVTFGNETISISGQDIMDALAGRVKPNHCPCCGLDCGPPAKLTPYLPCEAFTLQVPTPCFNELREQQNAEAMSENKKAMEADRALVKGVLSACPRCSCVFVRKP